MHNTADKNKRLKMKGPSTDKNLITHNVRFFKHSPIGIQRLAYNDETNKLALLRTDNSIEIWDCLDTPFYLKTIERSHEGSKECLLWCDGRLFSGSLDGIVVEHALTSADRSRIAKHSKVVVTSGACWSLAASPQGDFIAAGTESGHICLYSLRDDGLHFEKLMEKFSERVLSMSWNKSGTHLVAASGTSLYICSFKPSPPTNIQVFQSKSQKKPEVVWCVNFLEDNTIVAGDSRGYVSFWNGVTFTRINQFHSHKAPVTALTVCKQSGHVYVGGVDPKVRKYFKIDDGSWVAFGLVTEVHTHDVRSLVVDHKKRVLSGGADTSLGVYFFPPKTTYLLPSLPSPSKVSVSQNDVAYCHTDEICWWRLGRVNADTYKNLTTRSVVPLSEDRLFIGEIHCKDVLGCALNKSATMLAYSSVTQSLRVVLLSKPQGTEELSINKIKFTKPVHSMKHILWIDDGLLFTVDQTNALMIFEVTESSVTLKQTLEATKGTLKSSSDEDIIKVAASPCGKFIATANGSGVVVIYDVTANKSISLPYQDSLVTAICLSKAPVSSKDSTSVVILVAYANNKVLEFDAQSATITKFGATLGSVVNRVTRNYVITGISLHNEGKVLCLHDDINMTYISTKSIRNFNWTGLSEKKVRLDERMNGSADSGKETKKIKLEDANHEKNPSTNGKDVWVSRRKRSHRYYGALSDPYEFAWNKLAEVIAKEDSYIVRVAEIDDAAVASIEITKDTIIESLPRPYYVKKNCER